MGTRPGIMYASCRMHKKCVDGCPHLRLILCASQTRITIKKYTFKDLFNFASEVDDQGSSNFMGRLA